MAIEQKEAVVQIQFTAEERNLLIDILEERDRITCKKGLSAEHKWVFGLLNKITHNDLLIINEVELLKDILTNCAPDDLRRTCGAHEVARDLQILKGIIEKLNEVPVMT
jgi:hypothetical protein